MKRKLVKESLSNESPQEVTVRLGDFVEWYCGEDENDYQDIIDEHWLTHGDDEDDFNKYEFIMRHADEIVEIESTDIGNCWDIQFHVGGYDFMMDSLYPAMGPKDDEDDW